MIYIVIKFLVHTTFIHRMLYERFDIYIYELQHLIVTTSNISINLRYHICARAQLISQHVDAR